MSYLVEHILGGVRLLATSAVFYVTAPMLLALAVLPAALRSYQLFSRNDNGWLELLVELLRVVLLVAMVMIGRHWAGWSDLLSDISRAYREGWVGIVIELAVVTIVVLLFNAAFDAVVTARSLRAVNVNPDVAARTADAVIFAVKNVVVIPLYLTAMLVASGVIVRPQA
jgi:type IV secretory pathway VirB6-like protein